VGDKKVSSPGKLTLVNNYNTLTKYFNFDAILCLCGVLRVIMLFQALKTIIFGQ